MAKPYRRRKGGKFIGNFRVNVAGRDLNLDTKDANEAQRRARLAVQGKWPVNEAAANAAADVLDPARVDDSPAPEPVAAPAVGSVAPEPRVPVVPNGVHAAAAPVAPAEPLESAAAAAASEVSGAETTEQVTAEAIAAEASIANDVQAEMAKLVGPNGELIDRAADGVGAFALWAECQAIKYGVKWTLGIKGFTPAQPEPESMARKCLQHSFKALALQHFPALAQNLTPGWGIVIGLGFGAVHAVSNATIEVEPGKVVKVADAMAAEQQARAAQEQQTSASAAA